MDRELRELLQELTAAMPGLQVPFLVTLEQGVSAAAVVPSRIEHEFPAISAVSCKMTARQALDLAARPAVVRVEYDGELQALRAQLAEGMR